METRTSYLGLTLDHPFVAGASPLSYRVESIRQLEEAGCAAVVLHSLFAEQIDYPGPGHPDDYPLTPDEYAEHVYRVKRAVGIPVIGSINGRTAESWLQFARVIEQAGADAIELNPYEVAADLNTPGATIEARLAGMVRELKALLAIPVSVKLSPFFTSVGHVARQLEAAGADGLVLFNRFYQPDIDIREMTVSPQAELSTSAELPLRLRWLAILHGRVRPSLAASGGVVTPHDGIKAILAGADAVQLVSALLRHGPRHVEAMRQGLERWLDWHHMGTVDEARGALSLQTFADPTGFEREQYIRTLHSWTR